MNILIHPAVSCRMFFLLLLAVVDGSAAVGQGLTESGDVGSREAGSRVVGLRVVGSRVVGLRIAGSRLCDSAAFRSRVAVEVAGGYQREDLRWSIAGNSAGRDPNVYSELKWKGVGGVSAGVDVSWKVWKNWMVVIGGSMVRTVAGGVTDKDYGADDRRNVIYDRSFNANKGYGYATMFGLEYEWRVCRGWRLTPVVGYGLSGQRLSITDGSLLDSYYRTGWRGAAGRLSGEWLPGGGWGVLFSGAYHQVKYRAEGDWNLIRTFSHPVSFRHWGDGYGLEGQLGIKYRWGRVAFLLMGDYAGWGTGKGVDELYLATGQTSQTQLNEVVLRVLGIRGGVCLVL